MNIKNFLFVLCLIFVVPMANAQQSFTKEITGSTLFRSAAVEKAKFWGVYDSLTVQTGPIYVLDSIVDKKSQGELNSKEIYEYNENGLKIRNVSCVPTNKGWQNSFLKEWKYDQLGNKLEETWYKWDTTTNVWIDRTKFEYAYDAYSHLISQKEFKFQSSTSQWILYTYSYEYSYDDRGNLILSASYFSDPMAWNLEVTTGSSKSTFKYNDSNIKTEEVKYGWDDTKGDWYVNETLKYIYDSSSHLISDVDSLSTTKYVKKYTASGKVCTESSYYWNVVKKIWIEDSKTETKYTLDDRIDSICSFELYKNLALKMIRRTNNDYDSIGNQIFYIRESRDLYEEDWKTDQKIESTWSGEKMLEELNYGYDYKQKSCIPTYKSIWIYDTHFNLLNSTSYSWNQSLLNWIPSNQQLYQYSEQDKLLLSQSNIWSETANDWQGKEKTVYDYNTEGKFLLYATYTYNSLLATWDGISKDEYEYDTKGRTVSKAKYTYDTLSALWVGTSKSDYIYDIAVGTFATISSIWSTTTNDWIKSTKDQNTKDEHGNVVFSNMYVWNAQVQIWELQQKGESEFDVNNNLIFSQTHSWNTDLNDWTKIHRNEQKYNEANLIEFMGSYVGNAFNEWSSTSSTVWYYSLLSNKTALVNTKSKVSIDIYPNPASDNITITFPELIKNPVLLQILDLNGKNVISGYVTSGERFPVDTLQPGVYFCRITTEKTLCNGKLIIKE